MWRKNKLKPCPFCGGKAILMDTSYPYWIICDDCGAKVRGRGFGEEGVEESIKAWNRRTKKRRKEE